LVLANKKKLENSFVVNLEDEQQTFINFVFLVFWLFKSINSIIFF
jgi:hypothetical protein